MIDPRSPDDRVLAWLRSGPETAHAEFVERTLRPIPRMRQRRSWRVGLDRLGRPIARPVAVGLAVVLIGILLATAAIVLAPPQPTPPTTPTIGVRLAPTDAGVAFPDTGPFVSDPSATVNQCTKLPGGFWKVEYGGGDPYWRLLLLVGPEALVGDAPSDAVSAEIVIGSPLSTLVNFDQPGYRSGDRPGRSSASVETTVTSDAISFHVTATTPRLHTDFSDYPYTVDIDLTAACPT